MYLRIALKFCKNNKVFTNFALLLKLCQHGKGEFGISKKDHPFGS